MPDRVITAEALITAKDGTGDTFTRIAAKFQQLGKGAKVSAEIERMAQTLDKAKGQLAALDKLQGARNNFAEARARFQAQKVAIEQAARAMKEAEAPTRALESAYKRAQGEVARASAAFEKQKTALLDAKHAAESFGSPLSKIAADQARLKSTIDSTTQAIERQGAAELKAEEKAYRAQHEMERAHERALERRRHQIDHHGIVNYALGSAAMAVSAHGIVHVGESAIEAGAELQHERVASANAGRTPAEIAAYEAQAKRTGIDVPTASYTESMKTLLETTSAFGSVEHAIDHLTFMMKTAAVLKAASGGKIDESAGEMGQKFAKFFEMRGVANDPKRFEAEGNEMVRAMAFTGGTFNPREMFNFASQAKSALRNYDAQYLSRVVPSLAGETGGERAGTAANAFYNVIMGKARDAKQAAEWMKYGLLDPKMTDAQKGKVISWRAGAVKNTDVALRNPLEWFENTVLPAMQAKGVKTNDTMELSKVLATMFRNSMSNQFANENAQLADRTRLHKDAGLIDKTEHPDAMYQRNLADDPTQAVNALTASLNSLSAAVTVPAMKNAAGVITEISFALGKLSSAAMDHPIAAMTAGGVAGAAALGGAGYMSYHVMNGFGLGASATALDGSAAALTGAAAALSGSAAVKGAAAAEGGAAAVAAEGGAAGGALGWFGKKLGWLGSAGKAVGHVAGPVGLTWSFYDALNYLGGVAPHPEVHGAASAEKGINAYIHRLLGSWGAGYPDAAPHPTAITPMMPLRKAAGTTNPFGGLDGARAEYETHPALAQPAKGPSGPITATVTQPVPVDVTGKVDAEVKGQANVSITVKVDGDASVTKQVSSSSGNIKVSTGTSMPGAKAASAGSSAK